MSKKQYIKRHHLIISKLRKKPCSFEEISSFLQRQSEMEEDNYEISIRTFQRDVTEIASIYNIVIEHNRSKNEYEITHDANEDRNERLMETFGLFSALKIADGLQDQIIVEKRRPSGTENMHGLLHAIKNKFEVTFTHEKFWHQDQDKTTRTVQPLALKEARYRWYLIAKDTGDGHIKTFGLDRLNDLQLTRNHFELNADYNPEEAFRHCFGIITEEGEPQKITLSFSFEQGKYIKSLRLHHSQKDIVNSEDEYRIELLMYPTYDFIMELLSLGKEVKVVEPISLQKELIKRMEAALNQYK